jgi:hypothetical protein
MLPIAVFAIVVLAARRACQRWSERTQRERG